MILMMRRMRFEEWENGFTVREQVGRLHSILPIVTDA